MANFIKDKVITKETGIVFASEAVSALGAFIIEPVFRKNIHRPDNKIKKTLARLIEPHLSQIEKSVNVGHELHAFYEAEHGDKPRRHYRDLSREERAERIADTLIEGGTIFLAENAIATAIQYALKGATGSRINPIKTGIAGAATHLGLIGVSMTFLSKPTEWVFHKMADILPKITGMSEEKAKKTARNLTYVITPSFLAGLTEAVVANLNGNGHKK